MFALRLEQGSSILCLKCHLIQVLERTFYVEIININEPIFLGDQRKLSWEEIQSVSEYVVQREVHFANHFETISVVDEPLSLVPSLNKNVHKKR